MLAITAWVWSAGSRLREVSWVKVAITVFWPPVRTIAAGLGVLHPGLGDVLLEPRQRARDGPVMGIDDARVAADERGQGNGFRGREGEVAAGAVLDATVLAAPPELGCPSRPARLPSSTALKIFGSTGPVSPSSSAPLAGPGAGVPVRGIVPGVVAVLLVVARALGRGGDGPDRGHHLRSRRPARYRTSSRPSDSRPDPPLRRSRPLRRPPARPPPRPEAARAPVRPGAVRGPAPRPSLATVPPTPRRPRPAAPGSPCRRRRRVRRAAPLAGLLIRPSRRARQAIRPDRPRAARTAPPPSAWRRISGGWRRPGRGRGTSDSLPGWAAA